MRVALLLNDTRRMVASIFWRVYGVKNQGNRIRPTIPVYLILFCSGGRELCVTSADNSYPERE